MIQTDTLSRSFRAPDGEEVLAVRSIDLHVAAGEAVALLGPNGAGKSTLMRMLSTLLPPTTGSAKVTGFDVTGQGSMVREHIGYVGQGNGAGHTQRAIDEVVTQGRIYGLSRAAARQRAAELLATLALEQLAKRKTEAMSGGQRRRLDLAIGLVNKPPLLFLDEPTTGLDPQNRSNLWDHILKVRQEADMTVLFSTHYLEEADQAADRVIVVDHRRIIADGPPGALKQRHVGDRVTLNAPDTVDAERLRPLLAQMRGVRNVTTDGCAVTAQVDDGRGAIVAAICTARHHNIDIIAAEAQLPTLNDVFLKLTGRSLRDTGEGTAEPGQESNEPQEHKK